MTKHMDRSLHKERLLKEIEVRRKQEEQLKRREEVLKAIEEKEKEKEKKIQQANEEIKEMHQALLRSEQEAEEEHRAAEEREKRQKGKGLDEKAAKAAKEKEPELLKAVKLEPADEDWIEEVKELSSLRMCNLCNTRNYLRQGLCCNMYCQAFYMLDPHAGEKLTSRGKYEHGAKWSPYDWQKHAHPRIECSQLAQAFQDGIQEHAQELEEAMLPPPQVEGAAPFIADSVIIEDLDSGEKHEHPPSVPPLETMPDEYKQAIMESSKKKASKGVKRVLSLHAAIQKKKQRGLWVGPEIPMAGLTNDQQSWMNERVRKAIETAPWHRKWLSLDWQHIFGRKRCLLLLLFEVQDLLRGSLVAKISIGINLLRGDDLFLNIIGNKLPMFSQQRFASPHSQKHILPTLVALRPDPAAESCVDPQTVDNCVECSIVSYLVPSFCLVRLAIMEFLLHWLGM